MEVTGNIKSGWRKFLLQNSTATSCANGGNYKIRKHDTQKRLGYPKAAGRPRS